MSSPSRSGAVWDYRPRLDGLRAVAVLLVIAYHAGVDGFRFGFLGVDVFFVLSGYLVTRLVLSQHSAGSFSLRTFYGRRIRRLLPAALTLLVVLAWLLVLFEVPLRRAALVGDLRASALYVANWHFIGASNDYFASEIDQSPVVHFWSLAIEEQFYFAYPLVLLAILWMARRLPSRLPTVPVALGALALFSVTLQVIVAREDVLRAYYGTDTRLYQLLVGATMAAVAHRSLSLMRKRARIGEVATIGGVIALVWLSTDLGFSISTAGLLATLASLLLVWGLEVAGARSVVGAVLASAPAVGIGKLSYGIYLWHWPLMVLTRRTVSEDPRLLLTVGGLGGLAAAMASLHIVEQPVRLSKDPRITPLRAVVVGLSLSAVVGFLVIPAVLRAETAPSELVAGGAPSGILAGGVASTVDAPAEGSEPVPPLDFEAVAQAPARQANCFEAPSPDCTLVDGGADAFRVHLLGDSVVQRYATVLEVLAEERGFTLTISSALGCPWQLDMSAVEEFADECAAVKRDAYERVIPDLAPDLLLVASAPRDDPERPADVRSTSGEFDDSNQETFLAAATEHSIELLEPAVGRIVIVEPVPIPPTEPLECLQRASTPAECGFETATGSLPSEDAIRFFAITHPGVTALDLDSLMCPRWPVCDAIVGGLPPYTDRIHPGHDYLIANREAFVAALESTGAATSAELGGTG